MLVVKKEDGSIEDAHGSVIYFSADRYMRDIIEGHCCFICGAVPGSKNFNDEHIIPDWLLREFKLHSRKVTLPNGSQINYAGYKVPCCRDCNTALGETYERPVRELLSKGHEEVCNYLTRSGPWLIFGWLALIFLKTHLKDLTYRLRVDRRQSDELIGDLYDYAALHHIQCLVRAPFTSAILKSEVLGSFMTLATPFASEIKEDAFDYGDNYHSRTVMLRYHGTAFVAALDDSGGALTFFKNNLMRITAPVFPAQIREVHAHIAFLSANLQERPTFHSGFDGQDYVISAFRPKNLRLKNPPDLSLGKFLLQSCATMLANHPDREEVTKRMREGRWSFLFDHNGNQIVEGYRPKPAS